MSRRQNHLIRKRTSDSLNDDTTNASSSSGKRATHITVVGQKPPDEDGAPITLPLSLGPWTNNQGIETEGVISVKRYMDLQDEYSKLAKRYRFMHDEFAEMRIELQMLREERKQYYERRRR